MIEIASTRNLDACDRVEFWNELIGSTYSGMNVDPLAETFNARLSVWHLGGSRMVRPLSTAAIVTRQPKSNAKNPDSKFIIHTLTKGSASLVQRNRVAQLSEGDMVVCSSNEFYRFDALTSHEMMVVEVDSSTLVDRMPSIDDYVARQISGKLPGTRMLRRYMESLWQEAREALPDHHWEMHANVLSDLIVASLEASNVDSAGLPSAVLKAAQDMIAERSDEFDLGPALLARDMGIPLRTLQAAAARAGTTIGKMITAQRLQKATQLLASQPNRSVTAIAMECGFSDPSYFARQFQAAYGTSPKKFQLYN